MLETLKQYKALYQLFNFFHPAQLKHNLPLYKKYGLNKTYFSSISSKDFQGIPAPKNIYDEKDSRLEMPKHPEFQSFSHPVQEKLLNWSKDGYVVLDRFFSDQQIDAINTEVDRLIANKEAHWRYQNKIMFAINKSKLLQKIGTDDHLMKILGFLLGQDVDLFQSINFLTGSQQRTHSDSIHMTTFPLGNLIAAWVALEDISPNSGPVHYYPGSHTLPYLMNNDYGNEGSRFKLGNRSYFDYEDRVEEDIEKHDLKKESFIAKKGDVLIWHANLLHGGNKQNDPKLTRKSMVFHYYAKEAICYHEVTQRPTLKHP